MFQFSNILSTSTFDNDVDNEEEWYPPTPPTYDVTNKLIEVNRQFDEDPTPVEHVPGRLKWRNGAALVQVAFVTNLELN